MSRVLRIRFAKQLFGFPAPYASENLDYADTVSTSLKAVPEGFPEAALLTSEMVESPCGIRIHNPNADIDVIIPWSQIDWYVVEAEEQLPKKVGK